MKKHKLTGNEPIYPLFNEKGDPTYLFNIRELERIYPMATGKTLLQEYAGIAMGAIMNSIHSRPYEERLSFLSLCKKESLTTEEYIAKLAISQAEALIEELNKLES